MIPYDKFSILSIIDKIITFRSHQDGQLGLKLFNYPVLIDCLLGWHEKKLKIKQKFVINEKARKQKKKLIQNQIVTKSVLGRGKCFIQLTPTKLQTWTSWQGPREKIWQVLREDS